jgi:predicted PurR-regulated permease PerM
MADDAKSTTGGSALVLLAALVVIVAGLRAAQPIVVPFVVALFLAMICLPPLRWLQEKGLPAWLALIAIIAVVLVIGIAIVGVVGASINELRSQLPVYEKRVAELQESGTKWLNDRGLNLGLRFSREQFDAQQALSLFGNLLSALGSVLGHGLVVAFLLIFMLLEAADFPAKLAAIRPRDGFTPERIKTIQADVRRYVSIKTVISFANGALVAAWLWLLGVDFPLLWGLLTFLLNFVPNIGAFLAAVPAIVLAFLQLGLASAIYATAGYLVIEMVVSNIIEPRVMGRGLGLSPLVVFLSLVFWGWVLGPVGMLFSVPLTMVVKIALDTSDQFRWVSVLLGSDAPHEVRRAR